MGEKSVKLGNGFKRDDIERPVLIHADTIYLDRIRN